MFHQRLMGLETLDQKVQCVLELAEPASKKPYFRRSIDAFILALCGNCQATKAERSQAIVELCRRIFNDEGQLIYNHLEESSASNSTKCSSRTSRPTISRRTRQQHADETHGRLELDGDDDLAVIKNIGIKEYPVPEMIVKAVAGQDISKFFNLKGNVAIEDFVQSFHEYLYIEEAHQKKRSNYSFRWLHHAVDQFEKNSRIKDIIFPKQTSTLSTSKVSKDSLKFVNSSRGGLNGQQQTAVKNILTAKCRPAPYLVISPPGTGKTKTIIEAILQIYENSRTAKILVCANSNSCVNLLTLKILESKVVNSGYFVRIVSSSSLALIPENTREVTKCIGKVSPSLIKESYRIIITTCTLAGHLKRFSGLEFDYVFIAEAGQATEPETLLPIDMIHEDGLVVLSGDPYQLGPYYESNILDESAFASSLLERLYKTVEMYKRREKAFEDSLSHYDERYITKLIISHRSDPRVVAVNNKLFYDDDLVCTNISSSELMAAIDVNHPLVFHRVRGEQRQIEGSKSWWNPEELFTCLYYLKRLYQTSLINPDQVGITSPYRLQNQQFKKWIKLLNIPECKVDRIEAFQGQEREVMIISIVRTGVELLGRDLNFIFSSKHLLSLHPSWIKKVKFLFQPKRFNATTSRAKWINIAVGNAKLLNMDDCWSEYLKNAERLPKEPKVDISAMSKDELFLFQLGRLDDEGIGAI